MTLNKDRKQTKYGHKRREHMTHTTEDWHNSPLPEGVSHSVTVPPGRGGVRSGGPSGQTWTGTQDGDLQSGTDNGGHGGAGSSGGHGGAGSSEGHGRSKELRRPWQMVLVAMASVPSARPLHPELYWPWCVDWIHGARVSGSRQAWVSGDPAGLSQRRAGGLISSERRARWAADGGVISRERRAGWAADGGVDLPWTQMAGLVERQPGN